MSRGQLPRTREFFPRMKVRGGGRRACSGRGPGASALLQQLLNRLFASGVPIPDADSLKHHPSRGYVPSTVLFDEGSGCCSEAQLLAVWGDADE